MSKNITELMSKLPAWENALAEDGHIDDENRVTVKEAFASPDAPILFPKVISRTLREAAEPQYLVTPMLNLVRLGKGRSLEFPAVNAIQAAEIPEGQEYPEQALAFINTVEGKVSKKGVKVVFTEEVIADSLWDIVGLHVRAAGRAMARYKEQVALGRFRQAATTVFDNTDANANNNTTGVGANGAANGTFTWDDALEMVAALVSEDKVPTDFIMHPLMWSVFVRNAQYTGGGMFAPQAYNMNIRNGQQTANATAPMGLNVILSPFVSFTARSGATPARSDIFLIDRNDIGAELRRDDMSTDEFTDPTRDLRALKLKERYDIVTFGGVDGGNDSPSIVVARNVNLARNYDIQLTRTVA